MDNLSHRMRFLRIREDRNGRTIEAMILEPMSTPIIDEKKPKEEKRNRSALIHSFLFLLQLSVFGFVGFIVGSVLI